MIRYKKAKVLLDQVAEDYSSYDDNGLIDYTKLYKILRRCNSALGEKINPEKTYIIRVKNYKGYLPDDFLNLNYAFICAEKIVKVPPPTKGFEVHYDTNCLNKKNCSPCIVECENNYSIYQKLDENWTQFKTIEPVTITSNSSKHCASQCPNLFLRSQANFKIEDNFQVTSNFQDGDIYINYVGSMEDEDGDLLIIDDPMVEAYYENEVVKQIVKTALYNKEADVAQLYNDAKNEASKAYIKATSYVNTTGYDELTGLFQAQRKRLYNKFFNPILGY